MFFYDKDWEELNKPFQKHHVVNAFPEFKKIQIQKAYQFTIRQWYDKLFESLLNNNTLNTKRQIQIGEWSLIKVEKEGIMKFTFAQSKEGFDKHIDKSIRGYGDLWHDVVQIGKYFIEDDTNVVDIGPFNW